MRWYDWVVAASAAIGGLLFGYEIGIMAQVLEQESFGCLMGYLDCTQEDIKLTASGSFDKGLLMAVFQLGCIPGAFSMALFLDQIGRKRAICMGALLYLLAGSIQAASTGWIMTLCGRIIGGLGIGALSSVVPLYISEVAPTEIRGRLTTMMQLMVTIGIAIANAINAVLSAIDFTSDSETPWRIALGLEAALGLLLFVCMYLLPASPRWLMLRGKEAKALQALSNLRREPQHSPNVQEGYHEVKQSVEQARAIGEGTWKQLFTLPGIKNRALLAMALQMFQQLTGINAVMYYCTSMFQDMNLGADAANYASVANAVVNIVGTFPGMWGIEHLGRRRLMVYGGLLQAAALWLTTILLNVNTTLEDGRLPYWRLICAVITIFVFVFAFASSWGPVVWVYQSEIFPLRFRPKGTGAATMTNWTMNAIITFAWPSIQVQLGTWQFAVFGVTGIIMALFVMFFVPETKGKTLKEMDTVFGSSNTLSEKAADVPYKTSY